MIFQTGVQFCVIYVYCTELFPTKVRMVAMSVMMTISNIVMGSATYIIYVMQQLNLHPMSGLWVIGLVALVCAYFLPETKSKGMLN